jgi:hypothetical protein
MDSSTLLAIFGSLAVRIPVFGVWIVGLVLALSRPDLTSRVRSLFVAAMVILLIDNLVGTGVSIALPRFLMRDGGSTSSIGIYMSIWGVFSSLIAAVAWVLLMMAVFTDRVAVKPAITDTGRIGGNPSASPF